MSENNEKFYEIKIAGCKRKLKLFPVSDKLDIAAFIMFGKLISLGAKSSDKHPLKALSGAREADEAGQN